VQKAGAPATQLPWGLTAHGATGYAHQHIPNIGAESDWQVDTFGAEGNKACFSGLADWGAPYGLQRYVVCVIDGGPGEHDEWYSRWDHYGQTLGTHPIRSGEITVRHY
jgi:hypothetical protein